MTDEQLMAYLASQGNLSVEEKKLAQGQALTNALRQQAFQPATNRHWTSQVAKALEGIGAGYGTYKDRQAMDQYGANVNKNIGGLADLFLKRPQAGSPPPAPAMPGAAPSGFDDY